MEAIAKLTTALVAKSMDSSVQSAKPEQAERPVAVPTTMAQCRALAEWARALPEARTPAATNDQLERHLEFLGATLPTKNVDIESGKMRYAVYASVLGSYSNDALKFMSRRVVETLDWFPTPRQCLTILADYREPESERTDVLALCARFAQDALEQWLDNVRAGQDLGDVPDRWLRIGVAQGVVRRLDDGSHIPRAAMVGR